MDRDEVQRICREAVKQAIALMDGLVASGMSREDAVRALSRMAEKTLAEHGGLEAVEPNWLDAAMERAA